MVGCHRGCDLRVVTNGGIITKERNGMKSYVRLMTLECQNDPYWGIIKKEKWNEIAC